MSDTSILTAIKYKGKMIGIPQDSSVSWNDLTDKPVVIDTSTQTVQRHYDIASYQPIRNLKQVGYGWGEDQYGPFLYVDKESITNAINALSSQLTNDQKNIWQIEFSADIGPYDQPEYSATAVIDINNEEVLYFNADFGLTLSHDRLDYYADYWQILVNDPQSVLDDDTHVTVDIFPVNFITRDGQTVTSLTYTETITVPGKWYFDPDHVKKDASVGILWDTSMNGGSVDLSDYYTKTQIDTSIANNYASKSDVSVFITSNDISTFVTDNDVSIYLTDNDISTFITSNDISTKLEANDVSQFITANDISTFVTDNDISTFITANDVSIYSTNTYVNSTFAKISYISQTDYDNLSVKDPSTLYIIPS